MAPRSQSAAGWQQVAQIALQRHLVVGLDILTVPRYMEGSVVGRTAENAALEEYVIQRMRK
jgi:hypothetical protein